MAVRGASWLACSLSLVAAGAGAQTFREAVELARNSEPAYLGLKANAAAAQERSKQAFAGLLPQVNATAATNVNRRDYHTRGSSTADAIDHYNSHNAQLSLTQPIIRPSNVIALRQAETAVSQADYQLVAAEQDLLAKLVQSWFDAMSARDSVLFTTRQAAATQQQWNILRRGVDLGTASAPAAEEARAKHEQALAEQISAEMEFQVRAAGLEQIIGPLHAFRPPFLSSASRTEDFTGESLDSWLERLERSPQVLAATHAVNAADDEIRKQRALYGPTLDLVGSYGKNSQQVGNFPGQAGYDIVTGTIGLQLNIPLFAGGGQYAKVTEAIALRDKARQELAAAQRAGRLAAKQAWYGWLGANARYAAGLQALRSAALTLRAAIVGIASGVKTDLDRLQAVVQVETARRDFNKARYDLVASFVRLKAVAGLVADDDVLRLERMFIEREVDLQEILAAK
jgi:outer membrane protein